MASHFLLLFFLFTITISTASTTTTIPPPQPLHPSLPPPLQPLHPSFPPPPQPLHPSLPPPLQPLHPSLPPPPQPLSQSLPRPPQSLHHSLPPPPQPLNHSLSPPVCHSHRPPQNPPSTKKETHFNSIIDALTQTDDFKNWAYFLSRTINPSLFPLTATATLFIPSDEALSTVINLSPPQTRLNLMDPFLFPYHILPRRISFNSLCHFPNRARLPTLLPGFSLVIINHSTTNFTINSAHIVRPNLYRNALVLVHGIDSVLDYNLFGKDPPPSSPPPPPQPIPNYNAGEAAVAGDGKKVDPPVYHQVHTSASPESNAVYLVSLIVYLFLITIMGNGSVNVWIWVLIIIYFALRYEMSRWESGFGVLWMVGLFLLFLILLIDN